MKTSIPHIPIPVDTVEEMLSRHAKTFADKTAIIAVHVDTNEEDCITYRQLNILVLRTAAWLSSLGIKRRDRFAILMHNTPEVIILELAGALIGAAVVPLDSNRDTPERKIYKLKDTGATALFVKNEGEPPADVTPGLTTHSWSTFSDFTQLLPSSLYEKSTGTFEDYFVILYTSGTTAMPKGVLLTARACLLNAMGIIDWQKFTYNDVFNIVLPLHHINSTEFCLAMLLVGGTIVLNSRYSASKFWHIIHTYSVTNTSIVPTILHDLLAGQNNVLEVPTLKRICIGSAPVLPEETLRFYDTFGVRVTQGYGQTETALRVAGVPVDVDEATYRNLVKTNTIGTELANNHVAIMDKQNNVMPEGKEGEICIAGPILAHGYLNNPDETAESFIDGWFHSGDLGYWKMIRGKRFFFIIGRTKEIIIKGGINLSPSAIEDALLKAYPEINDVGVVGYPDERMGEEIAAAVVLKRSHLSWKGETFKGAIPGLSPYEVPKKIFVFDSLPKTSTGKIQRVEVKKAVFKLIQKEQTNHFYVRQISSDETRVIKTAMEINNARFPFVPSTLKEFTARTINGLVFGVFDEHDGIIGSLSCVRVFYSEKLKKWSDVVKSHNSKGDSLVCVAISVTSPSTENNPTLPPLKIRGGEEGLRAESKFVDLAKKYIKEYVESNNDHVLEFHRKAKGGIPGATVWKILENGRPEDQESMGYNVLMKYPTIDESTNIVYSNTASPATLLIIHALLYAKEHGIKTVLAFSRPAGFQTFLEEKLWI